MGSFVGVNSSRQRNTLRNMVLEVHLPLFVPQTTLYFRGPGVFPGV